MSAKLKRNLVRFFLLLHFIGLTLSIGGRFADFVVQGAGEHSGLQALNFSQVVTGLIARQLVAPGFWMMVVSGIAMTALRYGRRPPIWVWIKVGLNVTAIFLATPFVAPALTAARYWAAWSAEHGQLAPQYTESAARAAFFGAIVFTLFLINIPVAVWKPFTKINAPRIGWRRKQAAFGDTTASA